jgi:hypothetical protein
MSILEKYDMEKSCEAAEAVNTPYFKRFAKKYS